MNFITFAIAFIVIIALGIIGITTTTLAAAGTIIFEHFYVAIIVYLIIHIILMRNQNYGLKYTFALALCFSPVLENLYLFSYLSSVMENNLLDMIVLVVMTIISTVICFFVLMLTVALTDEEINKDKMIVQIVLWVIRIVVLIAFVNSGITL